MMEEYSKNRSMPYQDEEIDLLISLMPKFMRKSSGSIAWQQLASEFNRVMLEKYPTLYTERNKLSLHAKFNYLVKYQAKKTYDSHSANPLIKRAVDMFKFIGQRKGRLPANNSENEGDEEEEEEIGEDEIDLHSEGEEGTKEDEDMAKLNAALSSDSEDSQHGMIQRNENTQSIQEDKRSMINQSTNNPRNEDVPRAKKQRTAVRNISSGLPSQLDSQSLGPPNLVPGVDESVTSVLLFQHFSSLLLQLRREDQEREDRRRREDFERENYRNQAEQQRLLQLLQTVLLHSPVNQLSIPSPVRPINSGVLSQLSEMSSQQQLNTCSNNEKLVSSTEWEEFQRWKELQKK